MEKGYYTDEGYITEEEFAWSFSSTDSLFSYLEDCLLDHGEIEIETIKQIFLNQDRQYYYMECVKFQEMHLKDDY